MMAEAEGSDRDSVRTRDPNVVRLKQHQKTAFKAISDAVSIDENGLDGTLFDKFHITLRSLVPLNGMSELFFYFAMPSFESVFTCYFLVYGEKMQKNYDQV